MTAEAQTGREPIWIVVPGAPPSVNHYVRHTRSGHRYVTAEAIRFKQTIAALSRGMEVSGESYAVMIHIYLGKGQKGDIDNFAKLVLDGLVAAGTIASDAMVTKLWMEKHRDRENPRTEIIVTGCPAKEY